MNAREELVAVIRATFENESDFGSCDIGADLADDILESAWLATHDEAIRAEVREAIAGAIARGADRSAVWTGPAIESGVRQAALLEAAAIARSTDTTERTEG